MTQPMFQIPRSDMPHQRLEGTRLNFEYPSLTELIKQGHGTPPSQRIIAPDGTVAGVQRLGLPGESWHAAGVASKKLVSGHQVTGPLKTRIGAAWRVGFAAPKSEVLNTTKRVAIGTIIGGVALTLAYKMSPTPFEDAYNAFLHWLPPKGAAGVEEAAGTLGEIWGEQKGNVLMAGSFAGQAAIIGAGVRMLGPRELWTGAKAAGEYGVVKPMALTARMLGRAAVGSWHGGARGARAIRAAGGKAHGRATQAASRAKQAVVGRIRKKSSS